MNPVCGRRTPTTITSISFRIGASRSITPASVDPGWSWTSSRLNRASPSPVITATRLDGLACAVLIGLNEEVDEILLTHPQQIADGKVEIGANDILANLPYRPGCGLWFDHHMHTAAAAPAEPYRGVFGRAHAVGVRNALRSGGVNENEISVPWR